MEIRLSRIAWKALKEVSDRKSALRVKLISAKQEVLCTHKHNHDDINKNSTTNTYTKTQHIQIQMLEQTDSVCSDANRLLTFGFGSSTRE